MSYDYREWWKKFLSQDRGTLVRLLIIGGIGILLLGYGSFGIAVPSPPKNKSSSAISPLVAQEQAVAAQLTTILSRIPGVSSVSVAVTLGRSIQSQYAQQSAGDGTGNVPVLVTTASGESAVPLDQIGPLVQGVVVVSPSAANPNIRAELAQAVQTLLQVAPYQVLILPN